MKDNRGTTILLTVIGIATLLVAVVGATFAYFTAGVESTDESVDTNVTINSATVGTITFTHSNIIDLCDDTALAEGQTCVIYPGAQETKEFTVKADNNSTTKVAYDVYLQVLENTFVTENGLGYKVSATSSSTEDDVTSLEAATAYEPMNLTESRQTFKTGAKVKIASGVLGTAGATDTWELDVAFQNNEEAAQDDDQGAKFSAKIIVEASSYTKDGEIYTTTVAGA